MALIIRVSMALTPKLPLGVILAIMKMIKIPVIILKGLQMMVEMVAVTEVSQMGIS